ncbi:MULTISPECIES: response regulator transcription factor [unclassified Crossiella]|uniref:response regulator transcription factor n=1 Tax=unclassified Crossiella TaxID=2620835 RepID=UPI001FFE6AF9|nr:MULTISPECIES: response regulator transcription factor [unclassified Crossiella]MCK2239117.1 response regulator transcription factor [Crossiella sp. S99.2]MCK2251314.1 response regulator transcription factor [Crossiella sp. S99.1]
MTVKVVLLEDEEIVRSGVRMILESASDIEVVAEGEDGSQAIELTDRFRPDVVLTDIQMPKVDGIEVTRQLTARPEAPAVVILTTFDVDEYVHAALRYGAAGFLLKDSPPLELVTAVRVIASGEAMISPRITKRLLSRFATGAAEEAALARLAALTPREREVAVQIGHGLSNVEIGGVLFMSESTVKVHIGRIKIKLRAANRTQVAILVHDAGLL